MKQLHVQVERQGLMTAGNAGRDMTSPSLAHIGRQPTRDPPSLKLYCKTQTVSFAIRRKPHVEGGIGLCSAPGIGRWCLFLSLLEPTFTAHIVLCRKPHVEAGVVHAVHPGWLPMFVPEY